MWDHIERRIAERVSRIGSVRLVTAPQRSARCEAEDLAEDVAQAFPVPGSQTKNTG